MSDHFLPCQRHEKKKKYSLVSQTNHFRYFLALCGIQKVKLALYLVINPWRHWGVSGGMAPPNILTPTLNRGQWLNSRPGGERVSAPIDWHDRWDPDVLKPREEQNSLTAHTALFLWSSTPQLNRYTNWVGPAREWDIRDLINILDRKFSRKQTQDTLTQTGGQPYIFHSKANRLLSVEHNYCSLFCFGIATCFGNFRPSLGYQYNTEKSG